MQFIGESEEVLDLLKIHGQRLFLVSSINSIFTLIKSNLAFLCIKHTGKLGVRLLRQQICRSMLILNQGKVWKFIQ